MALKDEIVADILEELRNGDLQGTRVSATISTFDGEVYDSAQSENVPSYTDRVEPDCIKLGNTVVDSDNFKLSTKLMVLDPDYSIPMRSKVVIGSDPEIFYVTSSKTDPLGAATTLELTT